MADTFQGIRLGRKTIEHSRASYPIGPDVIARLETAEQIRARVDVEQVRLLSGLRAQLLKEGLGTDDGYLTISGPDFNWAVPINRRTVDKAREFVIKVNARTQSRPLPG